MKIPGAAAAIILLASAMATPPASAQWGGAATARAWALASGHSPRRPRPPREWQDADGPRDGRSWRRHCKRNERCRGYGYGYGFGGGYGGDGYSGIGDDSLLANAYGYFAHGGSASPRGGSVRYDYDRGYPYEQYSEGPVSEPTAVRREYRSRECSMEATRDRRSGRQVDVRICRN